MAFRMSVARLGAGITVVAIGLLVAIGASAVRAAAPDDIIAERRAGYKHMGENFKAMKDAVEAGADVAPLAPKAQEVLDWAKRISGEFPAGTETGGGTHAKPEVWSERPGFDKLSNDLIAAAGLLQQRAKDGDKTAFAAQFKATGAVCGECHRTYRYKV